MNQTQEIPAGWSTKVLADICDILIGGTPSRDKMEYWDANKEGKNIWISIRDLSHGGKYISDSAEYISDKGVNSSNVKPIPKGNVLMSFKLTIGKVAISDKDVYTNEAIAAFLVKDKSFIDSNFLYYALPRLKYDLDTAVKGATLNKEKLKTTNIVFPPLSEQAKIATILSKVDKEIEKVERIIEQTEKLKKGLMQKLLTKGIGHTKFKQTELGEIPEEWGVVTLKDISENLDNKRIPITKSKRESGQYPYYGATGIVDYVSDYIFDEELLLISEDGANLKDRNYPIAFIATGKFWVNNHAHIHRFEDKYLQKIVESYLNNKNLEQYLTGMAQPKLNKERLFCIPIPKPKDPKEIRVIAEILSKLEKQLDVYKRIKSELKKLKKGLMNDLLSGRVRINN